MSELTLAFTPLLPWPAFALLIVAALGVLGFALHAKQKGAGWRALALALLLAALADPSLVPVFWVHATCGSPLKHRTVMELDPFINRA